MRSSSLYHSHPCSIVARQVNAKLLKLIKEALEQEAMIVASFIELLLARAEVCHQPFPAIPLAP